MTPSRPEPLVSAGGRIWTGRICVTGGRDFDDLVLISRALCAIWNRAGVTRLAHGDCRGADRMAASWAKRVGVPGIFAYPADWERHGKRAGPIRNRLMLETERPDLLVAFPGNRGTANCVKLARELGVRVWSVPRDWTLEGERP